MTIPKHLRGNKIVCLSLSLSRLSPSLIHNINFPH